MYLMLIKSLFSVCCWDDYRTHLHGGVKYSVNTNGSLTFTLLITEYTYVCI